VSASGVQTSLGNLNSALATYQMLRGMSNADVLRKKGKDLQMVLAGELRAIRPPKGSIRTNVLARLKAGKFINIRESVQKRVRERVVVDQLVNHGKVLTGKKSGRTQLVDLGSRQSGQEHWKYRALASQMVLREIAVRESGIGFLSVSARYPANLADGMVAESRYGPALSKVGIQADQNSALLRFEWLENTDIAKAAVQGMGAKRATGAVTRTLDRVTADIVVYNQRKLKELAQATLRATGARP
jgi:hypothetical protein